MDLDTLHVGSKLSSLENMLLTRTPPSSDFLEASSDEPLPPSLFDDSPTDTRASESDGPIPDSTDVREDQEIEGTLSDTEGTKICPDGDSHRGVDVDEHVQECEDEIQPSRYSLRTSRRPPERYRI